MIFREELIKRLLISLEESVPDTKITEGSASEHSWGEYYESTGKNPPTLLLAENVGLIPPQSRVVDLGCGAGKDSRFLLEQGFKVVAIDADTSAKEALEKLPHQENLEIVICRFEDFAFEAYDAVTASYSLSFMSPEVFPDVFGKVLANIKPGGIFIGNIFAPEDEWNTPDSAMTFLNEAEVRAYFADFEIVKWTEEKETRSLALGRPKHWHQYLVVAKKKDQGTA